MFYFSQPQSQRTFSSPEWDVVLSCKMVTFSTGSGRFSLTDDRVGTAEKKCDTEHSQSGPVEQGYTQTDLGLGTPQMTISFVVDGFYQTLCSRAGCG